jgi:hypothetical protein
MNEYRFLCNEEYVLDSAERYRRQRHVYPWFIVVKGVCALGLSLLIAILIYGAVGEPENAGPLSLIALVLTAFVFLLLLGPRIDYFFLKRRLRKSPFYGDEHKITVSVEGVTVDTARSQVLLKWPAFTHARRVASGFLLFSGPTVFYWWPDSALTQGTLVEITNLLHQNIVSYEGDVS